MISFDYFTSLPAGNAAKELNTLYRSKLVTSFLHCFETIQQGLDISLETQINKAQNLDIQNKFSPIIFKSHSELLYSIETGDITGVLDAVKYFDNLTEKEIYDSQLRISSILTENWEKDFVEHLRNQKIDSEVIEPFILRPIINDGSVIYYDIIQEIENILKEIDMNFFKEYNEYATRLKLFHGKGMSGASAVRVYGAIYIRVPKIDKITIPYFCEHIVHEVSHLHLYAILAHDQLITNPYGELYEAPIRADKRPLYGILHATFVLSRMVRIFRLINKYRNIDGIDESLNRFRIQFTHGLNTLKQYAKMTENGKLILNTLMDCAEG